VLATESREILERREGGNVLRAHFGREQPMHLTRQLSVRVGRLDDELLCHGRVSIASGCNKQSCLKQLA
jgi:hypothetical protein